MSDYFHIASESPHVAQNEKIQWRVGSVLRTGDATSNPYCRAVLDYHHTLSVGPAQMPISVALKIAGLHNNVPIPGLRKFSVNEIAENCAEIIESHFKAIREYEFEAIRRDEFPHLPSRMRCVWLTENGAIKHWRGRLDGRVNPILLKVATEGREHKANEGHLSVEVQSISELRASARAYWRGEPHKGEYEILLEGAMKVLEIYQMNVE